MSQIVLSSNVSGTAQFTIAAPGTNNDRTVTLPDASGTLLESSAPTVNQLNGGQLAGMRNKIINGKMDISQRGTSFPAIASGAYSLDRWFYSAATTAVATVTQQADAPTNNEFLNSCRYSVTTADTSIAAGDLAIIAQGIEGFNARDLIGRTFTLSFWVRSSKTGTHCVAFRNSGADRTYVAEYTINAANTWEFKTVTVTGGLITAGTWNWTNGVGIYVSFALAAGSTFQTTAGAWQTGNFLAASNQVNCLDTVGNIFAITGVQLEPGASATPFEHRPFGAELALCQRYYQTGAVSLVVTTSTGTLSATHTFAVQMRTAPTLVRTGDAISGSEAGSTFNSVNGVYFIHSNTTSVASGGTFTASAEL